MNDFFYRKDFILFWLWNVLKLKIPCENFLYRPYSFSRQESLHCLINLLQVG